MHADFPRAFTAGTRFWDPDRRIVLTSDVVDVGELAVPTGVMVVQDPGFLLDGMEYESLARRAPMGVWPAQIAVARAVSSEGDEYGTVAAMRLRFSDAVSVRWEPAVSDDAGRALGVGVDGGRMAVFDRSVLDRSLCAGIVTAVDGEKERPASIVRVPVRETAELFVSDSGIGDGSYPAWWGVGATGAVTELIVDFGVLIRATFTRVTVPAELLREPGRVLTPDLLVAGIDIEVVAADAVPGPWAADYSSWPEGRRPVHKRPSVGLALRVSDAVSSIELRDGDDRPVGVNPGVVGPLPDGSKVEFWADDPRVADAQSLAVAIFTGNVPLEPPR